jgi:hypothetical protein
MNAAMPNSEVVLRSMELLLLDDIDDVKEDVHAVCPRHYRRGWVGDTNSAGAAREDEEVFVSEQFHILGFGEAGVAHP